MMTINQGNIFKVIHNTGCNLEVAKEALSKNDNWIDTFRYAKKKTN